MRNEPSGPDPDPADNQTETVGDGPPLEPERYTDRGEEAETAAFQGEGAYSGGDFAGGHALA